MLDLIQNPKSWFQLGSTTIVAIFAIWALLQVIKNKKNGNGEDIEIRLKKIETNDLHDLEYIRDRVDKIEEKINEIDTRLAVVETKIDDK